MRSLAGAAVTALLTLLPVTRATAAFECLPGPAIGGPAGWMARFHPAVARDGAGWSATVALGRPAAIDRLGWSYAAVGRSGRALDLFTEGYVLALEDLYRESGLGLWLGRKGVFVGFRSWQVGWGDGTRQGGGSVSGSVRIPIRGIVLQGVAQDLPLGRRRPAAPSLRLSSTVEIRPHPSLTLSAGVHHSPLGTGGRGSVRWSPASGLTVSQELSIPEGPPVTGIEVEGGRVRIGLWVEPNEPLGPRIGLSCSFRTARVGS